MRNGNLQSIIVKLLDLLAACLTIILGNAYFASYEDNSTPYTINYNTGSETKSREELSILLLSWFKESKSKLNLEKCYLIVGGTDNAKSKVDGFTITNSKKEKLLGIIFEYKLKFQYHI